MMTTNIKPLLAMSELQYRTLFETAQEGILVLNCSTECIEDANPFILNILNYNREELIGKQLWDIVTLTNKKSSIVYFEKIQNEAHLQFQDLYLLTKAKNIVHAEFISNSYFINKDKFIQCNIRDITHRASAEKNALELQQKYSSGLYKMVDTLSVLIESRAPYTAGRQLCVADLAAAIGHELNYTSYDVEAMSSTRPYRPALDVEHVLRYIEDNSGILFDSKVVNACITLFRKMNYKLPKKSFEMDAISGNHHL